MFYFFLLRVITSMMSTGQVTFVVLWAVRLVITGLRPCTQPVASVYVNVGVRLWMHC